MSEEDRIRSALLENLLLLYPQGPPADETQIQKWLSEIVNNDAVPTMTPACYETAMVQAVEDWKTQAAANKRDVSADPSISSSNKKANQQQPTQSSFSLFAQLDSAMFAPRMTLDDFQAATTPKERLALFQKVPQVDDLVLDWNKVLPLLQDGLYGSSSTTTSLDYAKLHRKWFGQGRASTEHWSIRCDLCQNILTAIMNLVVTTSSSQHKNYTTTEPPQGTSFSATQQQLYSSWILWRDMWMDLSLHQPLGHDETTSGSPTMIMGQQVLLLLRNLEMSSADDSVAVYFPAHFLAMVDPLASWFQAWTARMTPAEVWSVLKSTEILPDLWQRCGSSTDTKTILTNECQSQSQVLHATLRQHSLSILRSILVNTRVQWFPSSYIWGNEDGQPSLHSQTVLSLESLKENFDTGSKQDGSRAGDEHCLGEMLSSNAGISNDQLNQLFHVFFHVGISLKRKADDAQAKTLAVICAEAIDVILYGAKAKEASKNLFVQMLKQCQDHLFQQDTLCFEGMLSDLFKRME